MTTSGYRWQGFSMAFLANVAVVVLLIVSGVRPAGAKPAASSGGRWEERLGHLRPQEPERYFELAEEIMDAAHSAEERALAQHLFAMAGALEPERLGRSACLALADMENDPNARRRLMALAGLLPGPAGVPTPGAMGATPSWSSAAALSVAEALSRYRQGDGTRALQALKTPGADALLQQFGRLVPGGYARFMEDCKLYRGQQVPTLSSTDLTRMLRLEAAILSGGDRAWSSDLLLGGGQPLIEVDPLRLEESLGVDPSRAVFRSGRWVER